MCKSSIGKQVSGFPHCAFKGVWFQWFQPFQSLIHYLVVVHCFRFQMPFNACAVHLLRGKGCGGGAKSRQTQQQNHRGKRWRRRRQKHQDAHRRVGEMRAGRRDANRRERAGDGRVGPLHSFVFVHSLDTQEARNTLWYTTRGLCGSDIDGDGDEH